MPLRLNSQGEDILYALHTFEAENEDELAFEAGERIVVIERDDQYGDGWYQGRNQRGEVGLFPQSYTSDRPPSFYPFPDDTGLLPSSSTSGSGSAENSTDVAPPTPLANTGGFVHDYAESGAPETSDRLSPTSQSSSSAVPHIAVSPSPASSIRRGALGARRSSASNASVHSRASELTRDYDLDDDASSIHSTAASVFRKPEDGAAHRAALAARAVENAEKAAREERERKERRRREDEEAYERVRREGLIEGLQLSDESDEEGEGELQAIKALRQNGVHEGEGEKKLDKDAEDAAKEVVAAGGEAALASAPTGSTASTTLRPPLADSSALSSSSSLAVNGGEKRPRADTQPSIYAESTYSTTSSAAPPLPSPPAVTADLAAPSHRAGAAVSRSPLTAPSSPAAEQSSALVTATAAVAGAATTALAGAGLALSQRAPSPSPSRSPSARAPSPLPLPAEAALALSAPLAPVEETAAPVGIPAAETAPTPVRAARTPSPISPPPHTSTISTGLPHASSLTASPASLAFGSSATTAATSASGGSLKEGKELPADPMEWAVEDVVEWARRKGFDAMTVGKFEEHEISGDVLLEMDVAMLKEIDLIAFGRRVHIYNAIKELKARTHPELMPSQPSGHNLSASTSTGATGSISVLSPAMSGYEAGVDSPLTAGSVASPAGLGGAFQSPQTRWDEQQGGKIAGLGFEEDSQGGSSLRAPSSLGQRSIPNLRSSTSRSHTRQGTGTTFDSFDPPASASSNGGGSLAPPLPAPVPPRRITEETAATSGNDSTTDGGGGAAKIRRPKSSARPSTSASLIKPGKSKKGKGESDTEGAGTATSVPSSPNPSAGSSGRKGGKSGAESGGGGKSSFFGATLPSLPGRSRKPPPRVPSALLLDSDGTVPRARPRSGIQDRAKRSTRLFGAFGGGSGSDRSPTAVESVRSRPSNSTLGTTSNARDAPTTMKPKEVDPATKEMFREKEEIVRDGNLMDRIGRPDHSGWMRKKGEKYNTWKMRFFVLKGVYLYYLKSEQERKAKGVIDLTGYRVLSDPDIHPGEFGFKIVHDRERTHFFAAAEQITVRNWMKEIMKATILRDYSAPVVSSCDIEVLPLDVAKTMTPYPRPPSPSRRAQIQKERYAGTNPNTLTQKDAAILMDFAPGSPLMNGEALWNSTSKPPKQRKASAVSASSALSDTPTESGPPVLGDATPRLNGDSTAASNSTTRLIRSQSDVSKGELLAWVNQNLPSSCPLATDLSHSLSSGRLLVRLLENLSGADSGISDAQFDQFHQQEGLPFDTSYLDTIFSVFDFISPRVSTDDLSMEDMITGNEPRLTLLVGRMREKFPQPAGLHIDGE
ncbi:hypothetical protein JCM10213_005515 [Rhodosporidiobolus nylandii]